MPQQKKTKKPNYKPHRLKNNKKKGSGTNRKKKK